MKNSNTMISRALTITTVVALVFALNTTGALAGFWRAVSEANPTQFLYGYGADENGKTGYGYGYGYGYGSIDDGNLVKPDRTGSSGGSIPTVKNDSNVSGGGWGGWSNNNNSNNNSSTDEETPNTETPTTPVVENPNTEVSGTDSTDTVRKEGSCTFPGVTPEYTDISNNWARSYIRDLSKRGIMNGVNSTLLNPEGLFEPNRATTRIEFLKIALRSFCYDYSALSGSENFDDIADASWQAKVVELAGALGVINTTNNNFRPNEAVAKIEALKMILLIGETRSTNFTVDDTVTTTVYADVTTPWMAKYAEKARILGIVDGNNGNLEPMNALSRAQTAKVAVRSMNAQ